MGSLLVKQGVCADRLQVGGALIVAALFRATVNLHFNLTLTAVTNGHHAGGAAGPHALGDAVDVRSKDLSAAAKQSVLQIVMTYLAEFTAEIGGAPQIVQTSGGYATELFFGQLEAEGTENEHFHFQQRKGRPVPPAGRVV